MNISVSLVVGLFLAASVQAHAGDLGLAGAFSGAGQALGNSLSILQSGLIQQHLMEERERMEREREERVYQRQLERERAERMNYEQAERAGYERAKADYERKLSEQSRRAEYQQLMSEHRRLSQQKEILDKEGDSPQHRQAVKDRNRQVAEYHTHLSAYYQRYGLVLEQKTMQQAIEADRLRKWREGDLSAHDVARIELAQRYPDWETIVGPEGSETAYRRWLATQPPAYQDTINASWDPREIGPSIDRFKVDTERQAAQRSVEQRVNKERGLL